MVKQGRGSKAAAPTSPNQQLFVFSLLNNSPFIIETTWDEEVQHSLLSSGAQALWAEILVVTETWDIMVEIV